MYILSVDTTAKTAAVCVAKKDSQFGVLPLAELTLNGTVTHSESLLPIIDSALSLCRLTLRDMGCLAVSAGPGSFTGVRIGVAAVKGLSFALGDGVPCIPLSTLHCLAVNLSRYGENTLLCPVMDARREQFYNALFVVKGGKPVRLCPDRVTTAEELTRELSGKYRRRRIVLNGDGAMLYHSLAGKYTSETEHISLASPGDLFQRALSVSAAAAERLATGLDPKDYTGAQLAPVYLRLSQAERERNERLKNGQMSAQ